jgi:hypothetical protein
MIGDFCRFAPRNRRARRSEPDGAVTLALDWRFRFPPVLFRPPLLLWIGENFRLILVRSMRRCITLISTVLLVSISHAISGEITGMGASGKADGKQFEFPLTADVVKATPAWKPDSPFPPLGPRRAIEIATKQLHELVKDPAKWYFVQINLVEFSGDHWAYIAMFDRHYPDDVAVFGADFFQIPVLMSGATLKPKVVDIGPDKVEQNR